jgi:hypothetical protein
VSLEASVPLDAPAPLDEAPDVPPPDEAPPPEEATPPDDAPPPDDPPPPDEAPLPDEAPASADVDGVEALPPHATARVAATPNASRQRVMRKIVCSVRAPANRRVPLCRDRSFYVMPSGSWAATSYR